MGLLGLERSDPSGFLGSQTNHRLWLLHRDTDWAEGSNFQSGQRRTFLLQYNNTRPHASLKTVKHNANLSWTVLSHPPYSPDLAPSDGLTLCSKFGLGSFTSAKEFGVYPIHSLSNKAHCVQCAFFENYNCVREAGELRTYWWYNF